jgi:hypothetical protein
MQQGKQTPYKYRKIELNYVKDHNPYLYKKLKSFNPKYFSLIGLA